MCNLHVFFYQVAFMNRSEAPIVVIYISPENNYMLGQIMLAHQGEKFYLDNVNNKGAAGVTKIHSGPLIDNHILHIQGITKPDHQT